MKILHIATLVTPDGAYGGPIRVALNQLSELASQGHQVTLAAGHQGFLNNLPSRLQGVPVKLFPTYRAIPGRGFSGLVSPGLTSWVRTQTDEIDIAHIHLSRDQIVLRAGHAVVSQRIPYVVQCHGMVMPSSHPLAPTIDAIWTRRILRRAKSVLYLTEKERKALDSISRSDAKLHRLINGVPFATKDGLTASTQALGVEEEQVEVLYLARLHPRKRPEVFVRSSIDIARNYPSAHFTLVGPDAGVGSDVTRLIADSGLEDRITWEGALSPDRTLQRLSKCSIYVLPSVEEPFPMSVLEAMSLSKPVVITNTCGLAGEISAANAGIVIDESQSSLTRAISDLLSHPLKRTELGANAERLARDRFDMRSVSRLLAELYGTPSGCT